MKKIVFLVALIFIANIFYSVHVYADEILDDNVLLLQAQVKGSLEEKELRKKIIEYVLSMSSPLPVPDEATKYLARAEAAIEMAKDREGFLKAAEEYKNALNIAPWLPSAYYNLGIVQDKAGKYTQAIENLNLYLMAAPDSSDREDVQKLIYKIEYRAEEALNSTDKNSYGSAAQIEEDTKRLAREKISALSGSEWGVSIWYPEEKPSRWGNWSFSNDERWSVIVSVQGSQIYIKCKSPGGSITSYEGTIEDNLIQGYFRDERGFDDAENFKLSGNFEGEIWPDEQVILIIARGRVNGGWSNAKKRLVYSVSYDNWGQSLLLEKR